MRLRGPLAGAFVAVLAVSGCAVQGGEERPQRPFVKPGEFGTPDCFMPRLVRDFTALDDRNLIVFGPGRSEAYHVQVSPPSPDLRFADALAFESRQTRICGYAGDDVVVADGGRRGDRLSVIGVYRLDERALQGLRARFGIGEPATAPRPEPGAGAEIERDPDGEPR
jgi:hypothetical protein